MLIGKCSCDAVRYAVEDAFLYAGYCHCSQCRASSGAAFTAFAGIEKEKLEVTQGADAITIFEKNPDDLVHFCRRCGSVLFSVVREGRFVHVTMGTLVDDPAIRPMFHIFVGSKAPWHEIADALPQYAGFPPAQALKM
jgi:hypothetical protein